MNATTHTSRPESGLADPRRGVRRTSGPLATIGAAAGAFGVGVVALIYLVGAPFVAMATGVGQIMMEVRDNAVRPRPFVGARHGLPFLDPPSPPPVIAPTEE